MSDYEDDETRWLDDLLWRGATAVFWGLVGAGMIAFWFWVWDLIA